jgi:endonuclease/exonuclease/phosphatase family metal-dependent hydrolase
MKLSFHALLALPLVVFLPYHAAAQANKGATLNILCYNIHHALPPSKKDSIDLDAIARVINEAKPDLVALQEVDVHTKRSDGIDQAAELGRKTGLTPYFFKAIDYDGGEYGVAILSRFPIKDQHRYPLPTKEGTKGEPRVLATAVITLSGKKEIVFACTHLDAQRDSVNRELQIKAISEILKTSKRPVIIAGDFNAPPGSGVIRVLDAHFKRTCTRCDFTIPADVLQTIYQCSWNWRSGSNCVSF